MKDCHATIELAVKVEQIVSHTFVLGLKHRTLLVSRMSSDEGSVISIRQVSDWNRTNVCERSNSCQPQYRPKMSGDTSVGCHADRENQ